MRGVSCSGQIIQSDQEQRNLRKDEVSVVLQMEKPDRVERNTTPYQELVQACQLVGGN
jgi:hypothetical protein